MTEREILINRLTVAINEREGTELTTEMVDFYIGSDMLISKLTEWVIETEYDRNPVESIDVMDLWEEELYEGIEGEYIYTDEVEDDNIIFEYVEPETKTQGRRTRGFVYTPEGEKRDKKGKRKRADFVDVKPGDKCPMCAERAKRKARKLEIGEDGHALPVNDHGSTLVGCGINKEGHKHHAHCPSCKWSNF